MSNVVFSFLLSFNEQVLSGAILVASFGLAGILLVARRPGST
jgi:hypothetical protein